MNPVFYISLLTTGRSLPVREEGSASAVILHQKVKLNFP